MFTTWQDKTLALNELVSLIDRDISSRQLTVILSSVHKHRSRCRAFQDDLADKVFQNVCRLSRCANELLEQELLRLNIPPKPGIRISTEQTLWALVSSLIFKLDPVLSRSFGKTLIQKCMSEPTDLAFAMLHSDAIASLMEHHQNSVNASFIEVVISSTDDSRSVYALKAARWIPDWESLKDTVFEALLANNPVKSDAAHWLLNNRASCMEALSFAQKQGIDLSAAALRSSTIQQLTRAIIEGARGKANFALRHNAGSLRATELRGLSDRIKRLLGRKKV